LQRESTLPAWLLNVGQLLIGCALTSRFERDFLSRAPRFLLAVTVTVMLGMALATLFAMLLAWVMPAHPATTVLAMAPGGMAKMSITARVLQLGVPVVTAFHVTRMVLLVSTTGLLFRLATTWRAKRAVRINDNEDLRRDGMRNSCVKPIRRGPLARRRCLFGVCSWRAPAGKKAARPVRQL
jgi:membrane AbrB-like protein